MKIAAATSWLWSLNFKVFNQQINPPKALEHKKPSFHLWVLFWPFLFLRIERQSCAPVIPTTHPPPSVPGSAVTHWSLFYCVWWITSLFFVHLSTIPLVQLLLYSYREPRSHRLAVQAVGFCRACLNSLTFLQFVKSLMLPDTVHFNGGKPELILFRLTQKCGLHCISEKQGRCFKNPKGRTGLRVLGKTGKEMQTNPTAVSKGEG